jgi:hypothetical protein
MPASKRIIDFTNVKERGEFNTKHKPAGDYRMKIVKVDDGVSKAGNDQWVFTLIPVDDRQATYPYYCGMDDKQSWKVRNLFVAAGFPVPKKRVNVDPNKLVGKEIGATLDDAEFEGRKKSEITQTFPVSNLEEDTEDDIEDIEDEEEEERPSKRRVAKKTTKKRRQPIEDDDDDEDVDELDLEEL